MVNLRSRSPLLILGLLFGLGSPVLAQSPESQAKPPQAKPLQAKSVSAALNKAKVKLDSEGRLADLIASVRKACALNVILAPDIDAEAMTYSFRGSRELKAQLALQAALGSNGLRYDAYASCVYISSAKNPTIRPPEPDLRRAGKVAQKRLAEVVPVTIEREELQEAFETLGDLIGLPVRAPNEKEKNRGLKAPELDLELSLDADGLAGIDILRLVSRHLQVGIVVLGDEVVVTNLKISIRSDNTAAVAKRLGERPSFTLPAGTLQELAAFLEDKLRVRVFVDGDIAEAPVTTPPADLSLSSMLYLAPGIRSGIDHRIFGEALVFERRLGRSRPADYITENAAGSEVLVALRSQKLSVNFQDLTLGDALAVLNKLVPKAEVACDEAVAGREINFSATELGLKAILLHVARLTDTRIAIKPKAIRFEAPK